MLQLTKILNNDKLVNWFDHLNNDFAKVKFICIKLFTKKKKKHPFTPKLFCVRLKNIASYVSLKLTVTISKFFFYEMPVNVWDDG